MSDIECKALTRLWEIPGGEPRGLQGVDLSVPSGSFVSIAGESGAGKSTLLRILGGLDRHYTGELRIGGRSHHLMRDRELSVWRNQEVAYIFQNYQLLPHLTVEENLRLPFTWRREAPSGRAQRVLAQRQLERVGIAHLSRRFPESLSGGEQQRVAIARALIMEPSLILADEPTGSLDAATALHMLELLEEYQRSSACTLIVVSHDPKVLARASLRLELSATRLSPAVQTKVVE